jgi:hypothetical protein
MSESFADVLSTERWAVHPKGFTPIESKIDPPLGPDVLLGFESGCSSVDKRNAACIPRGARRIYSVARRNSIVTFGSK